MRRGLFLLLCLALAAGFAGLGVWQVRRLEWKQGLIERTNARLAAAPVAAPSAADWKVEDAYTRVFVRGVLQHPSETLVQAVTERGAGWWTLTPLRLDDGAVVLVNRGFVPADRRQASTRKAGQVDGQVLIVGLLRASEPHGGFLRANAPADGRWHSRDVAAIARARGLGPVRPYFIDADASPNPGGYPIGGLTVVTFRNNHLAYALTWFGLSGLSLFGAVIILRRKAEG